jgi:hypothetical protein
VLDDLKTRLQEQGGQLVNEWKSIAIHPQEYFSQMPLEGGFKEPLIFFSAVAVVNGLIALLLGITHLNTSLAWALTVPVVMIAGSFVFAGIDMLVSRALGGTGNYEQTYRAVAYSSAASLVTVIPIIGFFTGIYSLYLLRLGLERTHELTRQRAMVVVWVNVVVLITLFVSLMFMSWSVLMATHRG